MLAAAFVTIPLSLVQLAAGIIVVFAAVALAYVLGLDEGKYRGRRQGLQFARDLGEKKFNQLADKQWFPNGGHR